MDDDRFLDQLMTLDVSGDGHITFSDVWTWIWQVAVMPGDVVISLLVSYAPPIAEFFELSTDDYGGSMSNFISIASWLLIFVASSIAFNGVRNLDHALTARIVAGYSGFLRIFRVARRRLVSTVAQFRMRRRKTPGLVVSDVELGPVETTVLKCYASVDELIVLTPRDVAEKLNLKKYQVEQTIRRLCDLHLVEHSLGTDQGQEGHHISQAGQMYLIGS